MMTNEEVMAELRSTSLLNKARAVFSSEYAGIEQAALQRVPPGPVEIRRMEFEAVQKIMAVFSIHYDVLEERVATLEAMNRNANGHIGELSDQLAAAAARRVKIKEKANQLHGAMKFILAFYEPQNYLDTEAWKNAEAGARHAVKEYAALMVEEA